MFYVTKKHMTWYVVDCDTSVILKYQFSNEKDAKAFATKLNNQVCNSSIGRRFLEEHISHCDCEHPWGDEFYP